ncbi:MAG: ACT domain-containing protein [Proteobacteria bacterium]|nr:MAG: ACT domain-containing protein [Pseudomonadota bacterium]
MAETELDLLLATLDPLLLPETYAFVTLPGARYGDLAELSPVAAFAETEGLSLVVPESAVGDATTASHGRYRMITLQVRSSLDAVGLTARVSEALMRLDISANVIAAFHHDHLFVPADRAEAALEALRALQCEARGHAPPRT